MGEWLPEFQRVNALKKTPITLPPHHEINESSVATKLTQTT
jgi:hypothetical protein